MSQSLTQVYEVYIRTTPEKLWEALTQSDFTQQYFYDCSVESDWRPGSPLRYRRPSGEQPFDAVIEAIEPGKRLIHSFTPRRDDWQSDYSGDPPSRVTYEIEQFGPSCLLRVTHEHFAGETAVSKSTQRGWQIILSGLKTLLETGAPLEIAWPQETPA
jgi:uncharacterized protein YndB with AHSA1/START domain